jgi:hypothetical protein
MQPNSTLNTKLSLMWYFGVCSFAAADSIVHMMHRNSQRATACKQPEQYDISIADVEK